MNLFIGVIAHLTLASYLAAASSVAVHGHRGARARFPENTLPAFEYAMKEGADFLEMDMAVTKDRHIVISHDPHLSKTLCLDPKGQPLTVEPLIFGLTLNEVQKYDCGTLKNTNFPDQTPVPGTRRPSLDEVFGMVENSKDPHAQTIRFNIETKIFADHPEYTTTPDEFVRLFYDVVKKHQMEKRVVLQSFDYRTLAEMKKLDPNIPLSALVERPQNPLQKPPNLVDVQRRTQSQIISPEANLLTADVVAKLHAVKAQVHPWTVNKPAEWQKLVDMGVDGIITDDPAALIQFLKHKKRN